MSGVDLSNNVCNNERVENKQESEYIMTTAIQHNPVTVKNYLRERICKWYRVVKEDHGVDGKFVRVNFCGEHLEIIYSELGEEKDLTIVYYNDYTLEQLYNIWMEG